MQKRGEWAWRTRAVTLIAWAAALVIVGCSNGRGSVTSGGEAPPTNPPVTPPSSRAIGGTVSGLVGSGLVLQLNGAGDLQVDRDGAFTFANALEDNVTYAVAVSTQPSNPAQTCSVSNGAGTVSGQDITNVAIVCSTQSFSVGGTVSGLEGRNLMLVLNGDTELPIASNGAFTFSPALPSGSLYEVVISAQPQSPTQTCTVANASGTVGSGTVQTVAVSCATNTYALGGTVVGLEGDRLVLSNSNEAVEVQSDGTFVFPTHIASGGAYSVVVQRHPTSPAQACTVTNGNGTVTAADIMNVAVSCARRRFTVGGTIGGLAGTGLRMQNNGTDDLAINADGRFTFSSAVESGRPYNVTIANQPSGPVQECTVQNGSGTVAAANVSNVRVQCVIIEFTLGGSVSGLAGAGLVLQNNGGDNLPIAANGGFTFPTSLPVGSPYDVSVATQPSTPTQACTVTNGTGTMGRANVTNVAVGCVISRFNVSVAVAGLRGFSLRVRLNDSESLVIHSSGTYTFSTSIESGQAYNVTIAGGPLFPFQTCTVANGVGTVTDGDVEVGVSCT